MKTLYCPDAPTAARYFCKSQPNLARQGAAFLALICYPVSSCCPRLSWRSSSSVSVPLCPLKAVSCWDMGRDPCGFNVATFNHPLFTSCLHQKPSNMFCYFLNLFRPCKEIGYMDAHFDSFWQIRSEPGYLPFDKSGDWFYQTCEALGFCLAGTMVSLGEVAAGITSLNVALPSHIIATLHNVYCILSINLRAACPCRRPWKTVELNLPF